MFLTCKLSVKVSKNLVTIRPIRLNPVNFFRLVIRPGPVPVKITPIRSGPVRIFDPVAHWMKSYTRQKY